MKKIMIAMTILILVLSSYIVMNHKNAEIAYSDTLPTTLEKTIVSNQEVIEKELVIKTLLDKAELVGLEGTIEKEYSFTDKKINSRFKFIEDTGKRNFTITLHGTFKLGFDLNEIKESHIIIEAKTVKIITPQTKLLSFEAPYHLTTIHKEKGIFAKDFTEEDRKILYGKAYEIAVTEISEDDETVDHATESTKKVIRNLLLSTGLIEKVEFIDL